MIWILGLLTVLLLLLGPQMWVAHTMKKYSRSLPELPGTGGELAEHLITRFNLHETKAESTEGPDHYDPDTRMVRLNSRFYGGKSLAAIAVAAHEVGHAIQHHERMPSFIWRTRLARVSFYASKVGAALMVALPFLTFITKAPQAGFVVIVVAFLSFGLSIVVHFVTIPVEWDASFGKALPILENGEYIKEDELLAAKQLLRAAALTYVSAALANVLNVWQWIRILRR